uniref:Uncharacterized protein n=1 Tax=Populus trichocarpa TaxID=3694 RepID=A0A3N7G102_POPTR
MERQSTNRNKHRGDELEDIQRESQENRENRTQQGKQKQNNRKRKSKDQEGSLKTGASPSVCRFVQSLCETRHQGFLPESVSEDLSTTQVKFVSLAGYPIRRNNLWVKYVLFYLLDS